MAIEPIDGMQQLERDLRQAMLRRPAPPGLKSRILEARSRQRATSRQRRVVVLQRLAAVLVMAAGLSGGFAWRHVQDERRSEAARQQVLTALRVTSRALNEVNARLAAHDRASDEE